ncbi:tannase/feruloyl esterase family alpha/beta hydrolase [Noviherbaspirillum sp. DKR-6]|uniref:Tannase/feruloyl esterase family alpha/beta hydrolase n=2 Tax=Noviherbaspirillum pedocola TaxID=2801341 RepID=A0A934W4V7_9BURK|nr:tannase/feruloyl esterase family alpha/beta hydrolase [Noviherbaspirillum pedocola]
MRASSPRLARLPGLLAAAGLLACLSACGGSDDHPASTNTTTATPPATTTPTSPTFAPAVLSSSVCSGLTATSIPASSISLPSGGATFTSAALVAATDANNLNGDFCKVLGTVQPVDGAAPVIHFEINLPVKWNGKFVHVGGGGFDGVLITGLDPMDFAPASSATPLALGYATFGDDSGHVGGITNGSFAANDEALANYGRQSLKKTHDVAMALMTSLYKVDKPLKGYFIGSSTGGRDALAMVQNWPQDYDGIFINRPALNYTGLRLSNVQLGRSLFLNNGAGWINPVKTTLLLNTVMNACDGLDGAQDGIISNVAACKAQSSAILASLRCAGGADTGNTCLSDAQLATVTAMANPLALNYALANGVTSYGGYNILAGMVFGPPYSASRNFGPNATGPTAPNYLAASSNSPNAYITGDQWMKYFITRNASFNTLTVDPANPGAWQQRIVDVSALTDATSTNLDAFFAKGGKIIWTHGTADEVVSTDSSIAYYQQLVAKYGQSGIDAAVRFYLIPGNGHGGTGPFIPSFDSLALLSGWVEAGTEPANNIVAVNTQTKAAVDTSPAGTAARPLCRYPSWPKYKGGGADPNLAASFSCSTQ